MLVDGASLHCIPQERWSVAPSISILGNLELSSRKKAVKTIWSICTWHAHRHIEGHSSVCVCVCVCIDINELHDPWFESWIQIHCLRGCVWLVLQLQGGVVTWPCSEWASHAQAYKGVSGTTSGCSSDCTLQWVEYLPVVGVGLFGPLVSHDRHLVCVSVFPQGHLQKNSSNQSNWTTIKPGKIGCQWNGRKRPEMQEMHTTSRKRELKPPGQVCRCGQPSFTGQQSTLDICCPRVKSSPIPVVSLSIGSQPSNSTWHHLHLLIISSDQTGPRAYSRASCQVLNKVPGNRSYHRGPSPRR